MCARHYAKSGDIAVSEHKLDSYPNGSHMWVERQKNK